MNENELALIAYVQQFHSVFRCSRQRKNMCTVQCSADWVDTDHC